MRFSVSRTLIFSKKTTSMTNIFNKKKEIAIIHNYVNTRQTKLTRVVSKYYSLFKNKRTCSSLESVKDGKS